MDTYTVGELAAMAGITVRTLHHYDEIGLLAPTTRTDAGYRLYDGDDVDRLSMILTYRELGLGLDEIARVVDTEVEVEATLQMAHDRVRQQIDRLEAIAANLVLALRKSTEGLAMTPEEKLSVFGDFDPAEHREEASERWGDTDEFAESARRTSGYTVDDWELITAELDGIHRGFIALRDAGVSADSAEAAALVDAHRSHLSRWYYKVTPQIHEGLGQMYSTDPRFSESIDKAGEGLAAYLSEAIAARYA